MLKQFGEERASGEDRSLDPYRIGRAALLGTAAGAGGAAALPHLGKARQAVTEVGETAQGAKRVVGEMEELIPKLRQAVEEGNPRAQQTLQDLEDIAARLRDQGVLRGLFSKGY